MAWHCSFNCHINAYYRCLARELFIHYGGKWIRRVRLDEHPLQLFYRFLREIGHTSARRMQLIGMKEDLAPLFKFVGGI